MGNKNNIIVALDGITKKKALQIAAKLKGKVWGFKINDLLFEAGFISKLKKFGKIFADAKVHDIPSTAARIVARLDKVADIITVHSSGGYDMMKAAKGAARHSNVLGVTFLTSLSSYAVPKKEFLRRVNDISRAGLDGLVCSAHELIYVKKLPTIKAVPGIRPIWYRGADDQVRTTTPFQAITLGADYIIIGRPIINSKNYLVAVNKILEEIQKTSRR